jgi:hypothetical protein
MPRNSDFPDYKGISVDHVNDWNAISYHAPETAEVKKTNKSASKKMLVGGFQPVKGVVKAPKKGSTKSEDLYQKPRDPALERAADQEWRTRGISNNEIIDH